MNALLEISGLTKQYGSRIVLHAVDLRVDEGESIAITGRSGTGKSTLLNIIGLLDRQTSGEVRFCGTPLAQINSRAATRMRRDHINYLFQSFALISSATALENVLLGLHNVKLARRAKTDQAMDLLERLGLAHVAHDKVATLSGGERQRVALVRCFLKPGELVLADEPTGALDDALADTAVTEMLQLQRDFGKTLIVVTHDRRVAQRCDRIVALDNAPQTTLGDHAMGARH